MSESVLLQWPPAARTSPPVVAAVSAGSGSWHVELFTDLEDFRLGRAEKILRIGLTRTEARHFLADLQDLFWWLQDGVPLGPPAGPPPAGS